MKWIVVTVLLFCGFGVYLYVDGHNKNPALDIDLSKEDIETLDVESTNPKRSSGKSNILEKPIDLVRADPNGSAKQEIIRANDNENENDRDSEDVDSTYYFDAEDVANSGSNYDPNVENDPQNNAADVGHMRMPASDGGVQEENNNETSPGDNDGKNN